MKTWLMTFAALAVAASASAHVTVAPQQSPAGATQTYKVRIHNGGKVATSSIELKIPDGVEIENVAPVKGGKSTMSVDLERKSLKSIIWTIAVLPGKYVELAFTAKNPSAGSQLTWVIDEHFADGSVAYYSDKPGARDKASITKLTR